MTIVHLIPFPIGKSLHGGQIRSRETNRILINTVPNVKTICIFDMEGYTPDVSAIDLSKEITSGRWTKDWKVRDYVTGAALAETPEKLNELAALIPDTTSLIVVEEPWLARAALVLKEKGLTSAKILYNSYNVETIAKKNILSDADPHLATEYLKLIEATEKYIVTNADHVTTVTEADASFYRQWRAGTIDVAPNGSEYRTLERLRNVRHHGIDKEAAYALFVASAHSPNVQGFKEFLVDSIDALKNQERVIVAGSVCNALYDLAVHGSKRYAFRDKVGLLGNVSDFGLASLITNASVILLPISYGGGSNLKTAEALLSGKSIVGTSKAFRGYEQFATSKGVRIADTQSDFANALRQAFDDNVISYERVGIESLLWKNTLSPIVNAVRRITGL